MISFGLNNKGFYELTGIPGSISAGVTGRKINMTDYSAPEREMRESDRNLLSSVTGLDAGKILMLEQVHGDRIFMIDKFPRNESISFGEGDGMITPLPGLCLVIRTADCVPVFLYDRGKQVIGAVHSGWKGTHLDITGKCIGLMREEYGSDPRDISSFILPSIGPESYEVNRDVADFFPDDTILRDGKIYVNLWGSIEKSCVRCGLNPENIYNTGICNRRNTGDFFSHRYGDRGRNLNFIFMKKS